MGNQFKMSLKKTPLRAYGYHVANEEELARLDGYIKVLSESASFYRKEVAKGRIIYLVKQSNEIKALPVKFGTENFAHLTGLVFDRKDANQTLNDLADKKLEQNAILVKNDGTTFQKLSALSSFSKLINSETLELNPSAIVPQAKKLQFNKALKTSDKKLLLALKRFELKVYTPFSLINLTDHRGDYSDYSKVPENTVVAVLSLTRNQLKGFSIGTLSVNSKYVKDGRQLTELTTKMRQILLKEYVALQSRRKQIIKQQTKPTKER